MQEQFRRQKSCQNRIIGLDLVRSCAILFVIAGHFFVLNTPFKNTDFGIYFFVIVPILFIGSFLLAWVKEGTFCLVKRLM